MEQNKVLGNINRMLTNELSSVICDFKRNTYKNLEEEFVSICKSLEVIEQIQFKSIQAISESTLLNAKRKVPLEKSRVSRYKCFFDLTDEATGEIVEKSFYFDVPVLIDGEYFFLYGTRYRPITQFVNFKPVHTIGDRKYSIVIKTLINKLVLQLRYLKSSEKPVEIQIDLFKKKCNLMLLLILLVDKDFNKLMDAFFDNWSEVKVTNPDRLDANILDLKTKYFAINDTDLLSSEYKMIVFNSIKKLKLNYESFDPDSDYLLRKLGNLFTTNSNTAKAKGERVLVVISRMLDGTTKKYLDSSIDNIFDLITFEIKNIHTDDIDNNNAIENRRLQFTENIYYPLLERLSNNLYIYLNSNYKSFNKLSNIFKIQTDIIIKHVTTNDLVIFDDSTSAIDTLIREKVALVPQGLKKNKISNKSRLLNSSYLGTLDIITSSNGDSAGLTTLLTPIKNHLLPCSNGLFIPKEKE